ncbi:MAG: tetratricopeptide repeat protein [Stagnimonas sp.]|nr:tetratricopeptide repeat protein [Stagnimonas sp.]
MKTPSRRLTAIVFTDVVGYSAVVHRDERLGDRLLERQRSVVRKLIPAYGGREVSTAGDSFLLQFDSTLSAVEAVIAIQQRLAREPSTEAPILLRASVHLGDVEHRGGDLYGDGVNAAARLLPLSPEGGLALSSQALSMIRPRIELPVRSLGMPPLKNIVTPIEVFVVEAADLACIELQAAVPPPTAFKFAGFGAAALRIGSAAVIVVIAVLMGWGIAHWSKAPAPVPVIAPADPAAVLDKSIAVLPFANMSEDKGNGYFADGMQDEILTALAKIKALKVISRTSTEQFRGTTRKLSDIGSALGVTAVLEGSVQRLGNRVRINVQLINARTDSHLWAESYDRELTDLFAVQSDVARGVAAALQASLLPAEQKAVGRVPTQSAKAHDLYLKASALERRGDDAPQPDDIKTLWPEVVALYRQALAEDPQFALAAAAIGRVQMRIYYYGAHDKAQMADARSAAEQALRLDPDLAEAHLALGLYHYWGRKDYGAARAALETAHKLQPSNANVRGYLGVIARRQGRWDEAVEQFRQAVGLDPQSTGWWEQLAIVYRELNRWPENEAAVGRLMALVNDPTYRQWWLANDAISKSGDLAPLRDFLAGLKPGSDAYRQYTVDRADGQYLLRDFDAASAALDEVEERWITSAHGEALQPKVLRIGMLHYLKGDLVRARPHCEEALRLVDAALREHPEESASHFHRGYALACLARRTEAVAAAERGAALTPVAKDALAGANFLFDLASVYALTGDRDRAIETLRQLLSVPGDYSKGWLRVEPQLDALHPDLRFQLLLKD